MPAKDDIPPSRNPNASWLVLGLVVIICVAIGVIVWSGGWGFSNTHVASPNPAPPATPGAPATGTAPRTPPK